MSERRNRETFVGSLTKTVSETAGRLARRETQKVAATVTATDNLREFLERLKRLNVPMPAPSIDSQGKEKPYQQFHVRNEGEKFYWQQAIPPEGATKDDIYDLQVGLMHKVDEGGMDKDVYELTDIIALSQRLHNIENNIELFLNHPKAVREEMTHISNVLGSMRNAIHNYVFSHSADQAISDKDMERALARAGKNIDLFNRHKRLVEEIISFEDKVNEVEKKYNLALISSDIKKAHADLDMMLQLRSQPNADIDQNDQLLLSQQRNLITIRNELKRLASSFTEDELIGFNTRLEELDKKINSVLEPQEEVQEEATLVSKFEQLLRKIDQVEKSPENYQKLKDYYQEVLTLLPQAEALGRESDTQADQKRLTMFELYPDTNINSLAIRLEAERRNLISYFNRVPRTAQEEKLNQAFSGGRESVRDVPERSIQKLEAFLNEAKIDSSMNAAQRRKLYDENQLYEKFLATLQTGLSQNASQMNPADVIAFAGKLDQLAQRLEAQRNNWRVNDYSRLSRITDKVVLTLESALESVKSGFSSRWNKFLTHLHHQSPEAIDRKVQSRIDILTTVLEHEWGNLRGLKDDRKPLNELRPLIDATRASIEQSLNDLKGYCEDKKGRVPNAEQRIAEIHRLEEEVRSLNSFADEIYYAAMPGYRGPLPTTLNQPLKDYQAAIVKLDAQVAALRTLTLPPFEQKAETIPARAKKAYEDVRQQFTQVRENLPSGDWIIFSKLESEFFDLYHEKNTLVEQAKKSTEHQPRSFNPSDRHSGGG